MSQKTLQYSGTPTNGQVARYNASTKIWEPITLPSGGSANTYATYASRAALTPVSGDVFTASENGARFVYTGSIWRPLVDDSIGVEPTDPSGWTWCNRDGTNISTATLQFGRVDFFAHSTGGGIQWRGKTTPMGTPATAKIRTYSKQSYGGGTAASFSGRAVAMRESSTGKVCLAAFIAQMDNAAVYTGADLSIMRFSGNGSTFTTSTNTIYMSDCGWLGLEVSGTDILAQTSNDGRFWRTFGTYPLTTAFTTAPDEYGYGPLAYAGTFGDVQYRSVELL